MQRIDLRDRSDLCDPQDTAIVAYCAYCGSELYAGDMAYIPAEYVGMVCTDCVKEWLYETYVDDLGTRCVIGDKKRQGGC